MDKVSDGRSVCSVPVAAEDLKNRLRASQDRGNNGDKVTWLLSGIFTQET
jgi:hypothetical protein